MSNSPSQFFNQKSVKNLPFAITVAALLIVSLLPGVHQLIVNVLPQGIYAAIVGTLVFCAFAIAMRYGTKDRLGTVNQQMRQSAGLARLPKAQPYQEDRQFYFRDLPFDKDLFYFFWVAYQYDLATDRANLLNALLLKWLRDGLVTLTDDHKHYVFTDRAASLTNPSETELYQLIHQHQQNECIQANFWHSHSLWLKIDELLARQTELMRQAGKVASQDGQDTITAAITPDADAVYGLKHFLLDFSTIKDKRPEEVALWDEYLIYAEILGISDRVRAEFSKAGIDYASKTNALRRINQGTIGLLNILFFISLLFYSFLFTALTALIWLFYATITYQL